ncbi:MAG: MATE family efflux transporter [Firmicutes bacterium]|nr:MATE family efflux transporter [Bacillota bacterium]
MEDGKTRQTIHVHAMTEGSPLRHILTFMLPVLLGQVVQQTYNMVDSIIVGRLLGADALAAVGASSSVQFMILGFCSGMCDGFAIYAAQSFGAGNLKKMRRYVYHMVLMAALIAAILTVVTCLACGSIISVLQTPDNIRQDAVRYLMIIFLGIPFTIFYNIQASILRAVGDSREPFLFLALSSCLNIFLDLFCVAVLHWGVAGAAIATITSQALSGCFCLLFIRKKMEILHVKREEKAWNGLFAKNLIAMGIPMGLQFSITAIGSMVMQACNNSLGSVYVSGYTAGDRVEQLVMCPYVALSSSMATYVGQNYGALKFDRIRKGVLQAILMAHLYGLVFGSLMAVFGRDAASMFLSAGSGTDAILDVSEQFLKTVGFTFWLVSSVNVFRPAIQAMDCPGKAIFSGVIEMAARTIFSLATIGVLGFTAICWTHQMAWISAGLYVILMYRSVVAMREKQFAGAKAE